MPHLTLKQGDTVPDFVAEPEDLAGLERELTGDESIRFYMEHDETGDLIVNQPVTEVRESQPEIVYDFSAGETSRAETHYAEIVVTYADGDVETVRDDGYFEVEITEPTNRDVPPADLDSPDIDVGVVDASEVQAPTLSAVETLTGSITGGQTVSDLVGRNLYIEDETVHAESVADSASHTNPTYDSDEDGTIDAAVDNQTTTTQHGVVGENPAVTITETASPSGFSFTAGADSDVHTSTDVTLSNGSTASATEDITVEYYDGADTTGTLVTSGTQSVTVAAGDSTTATFLTSAFALDAGDYYIAVSQSGSTLAIDQTDEHTLGGRYETTTTDDGTRRTTDHRGNVVGEIDPVTGERHLPATHTQELSVSDNAAVTGGPVGDEGEFFPLDSCRTTVDQSTTNTSYSDVLGNAPRIIFDLDKYDLSNVSGIYISASVTLHQDTAEETVSMVLRVNNTNSNAEVTISENGFTKTATPIAESPQQSGITYVKPDLKVSGGTGSVYNDPLITIWGKIV